MANHEFGYDEEDIQDVLKSLEEIDRDKLQKEFESNPGDEGYSYDAPQEFADADDMPSSSLKEDTTIFEKIEL